MAADQSKSDIVMMFTDADGQAVLAECALEKDKDDLYMSKFKPQTYDTYSNFFEVKKFRFEFEVKDEDKSKAKVQGGPTAKKANGRVQGDFASWRSANNQQASEIVYPLEFESFSFERLIDAASLTFFTNCCNSVTFPSATLVKRVSVGNGAIPRGFLKLDFTDVLITSVSWDDGDMTTEKCEFICHSFTVAYKQLLNNGTFGAAQSAGWDHIRNALPTR